MKKLSLLLLLVFIFTGCATGGDYASYVNAKQFQMQAEANRKPLVDLTISEDGKLERIAMYSAPRQINIQQKKDHPIYRILGSAVGIFGGIQQIKAYGSVVTDIIDAGVGDVTNSNNSTTSSSESSEETTITTTDGETNISEISETETETETETTSNIE